MIASARAELYLSDAFIRTLNSPSSVGCQDTHDSMRTVHLFICCVNVENEFDVIKRF